MKYGIQVTQDDLKGDIYSSTDCPMARAIKRETGFDTTLSMNYSKNRVVGYVRAGKGAPIDITLPPECYKFVENFKLDNKYPLFFEVTIGK